MQPPDPDEPDDESLPVRERGLKLESFEHVVLRQGSLPVWERGLKQGRWGGHQQYFCRSPCGSVD